MRRSISRHCSYAAARIVRIRSGSADADNDNGDNGVDDEDDNSIRTHWMSAAGVVTRTVNMCFVVHASGFFVRRRLLYRTHYYRPDQRIPAAYHCIISMYMYIKI